jgi:xanthine dehydrogenase accessory factor
MSHFWERVCATLALYINSKCQYMSNNDLPIWQFTEKHLRHNRNVMLMVVLESEGSSPGRKGFKMAVALDDTGKDIMMIGSIGGGIMEQKLATLAQDKLLKNETESFRKKQIHNKDTPQYQSGMICSGAQTILFKCLTINDLKNINTLITYLKNNTPSVFSISETHFSILKTDKTDINNSALDIEIYIEKLGFKNHLYIIGAGHCGLALSELMSKMDFYIHLMDDRQNLNTFEQNTFVHEKHIVDFNHIANHIPSGAHIYIVIMTVGYRTDALVMRQLMDKQVHYKGVLGSPSKINTLIADFKKEGYSDTQLAQFHMPIGLKINSQTPMEIAVSIAGEIISLKG